MRKIAGIMGGMGPWATLELYKRILNNTEAKKDQEHLHLIIDNNTKVPDRTDYILGKKDKSPLPFLMESAMKLQLNGADLLAMPCNTAHFFYEEIKEYIQIEFINMIQETAREVKNLNFVDYNICLLATSGTYQSEIYQEYFSREGLDLFIPDKEEQEIINSTIYQIKKFDKIKDKGTMNQLLSELEGKGAELFITGCTELSFVNDYFERVNYIDPLDVLVQRVINFMKEESSWLSRKSL